MSGALLGQFLALMSAASFALSNVFIARAATSRGDRGVMFSVVVTIALSGLAWLVLEGGQFGAVSGAALWRGLGWYAFAGLCAMVFGRSLLYASIRALGVARSSAVKRLNPFFSVLLAALILGEPVTHVDGLGMLAIAGAFGLLIRESMRRRGRPDHVAPGVRAYGAGVFAALAYAMAYIARKLGLGELPMPALGTFVSALSGMACFAALAAVSPERRRNFLSMFANLDRWVVLAAVLVSAGQILLFAALAHEDVSTVVMIASLEIFISIFLSVVVFRTEPVPGVPVLAAAALAAVGVVMVAI